MSKRDGSELTLTSLFALSRQRGAPDRAGTVGTTRKLLAEVVARRVGRGGCGVLQIRVISVLGQAEACVGWPRPDAALLLSEFLADSSVRFYFALDLSTAGKGSFDWI